MVPTHVGVYHILKQKFMVYYHGPHACGGVPDVPNIKTEVEKWSPRMWGCTEVKKEDSEMKNGPHACGGVPSKAYYFNDHNSWSPRMWGCTESYRTVPLSHTMVPTHVGVYRS